MKYDDASWHYGADSLPKDRSEEYCATYIGLLLKWYFIQGWAGALHKNQLLNEIDILDSQATAFVDPETSAIDNFQHQANRALGISQ